MAACSGIYRHCVTARIIMRYISAAAGSMGDARTVYERKTSYILCRSLDHHMHYNYSYGCMVDNM